MRRLSIVVAGNGTVGYWTVRRLALSRSGRLPASLVLVDPAVIGPENAVTCPGYAGAIGERKCRRLAALAGRWFGADAPEIIPLASDVEDLDWRRLLAPCRPGAARRLVAVSGLDDWGGRLRVCGDLRDAARGTDAAIIQTGLDKEQASVAVYGPTFDDCCPACNLPFLPASEPCVLYDGRRRLVRGDLRREARAAALLVVDSICKDLAAGGAGWLNTKTNLFRPGRGPGFCRFTRPCRMAAGCLGPHSPHRPLRWDKTATAPEVSTHGGR